MLTTQDHTPCWSRLSLDPEKPGAIVISVNPDLAQLMRNSPKTILLSKDLAQDAAFASDPDGNWGFGSALKRLSATEDEFMSFLIDPPTAKIFNSKPCPSCKGTGNDCLDCDGGYSFRMDWDLFSPLCVSLQLLSALFEPYRVGTQATRSTGRQLLSFEMFSGPEVLGFFAAYSPVLVKWLSGQRGQILVAEEAMMATWNKILPTKLDASWTRREMRVDPSQTSGWINISCSGSGCGLFPNHNSFRGPDVGYESSDHNIDHPGQQFALLAALAAIETQVRKELWG